MGFAKGRSENFESTVSETNTSPVGHNDIAGIKTRLGAISCIETYRSNTSVRNVARWVDTTIETQSTIWQTSHNINDCRTRAQFSEHKILRNGVIYHSNDAQMLLHVLSHFRALSERGLTSE